MYVIISNQLLEKEKLMFYRNRFIVLNVRLKQDTPKQVVK